MNPNQKEAIINLFEDIKDGIEELQGGLESEPATRGGGKTAEILIHRENTLHLLKSILASATTGIELLREQTESKEQAQ